MKILHTSDWHLGKKLEGLKRIEEQKKFIDTLEMIVKEEEPKVILIAGDIFDTPNPSSEAESLFFDSLKKLSDSGKRAIVIIPGNHDSPERLSACKNLARDFGVIIYEKPFEKKEVGKYGNFHLIKSSEGGITLDIEGEKIFLYSLPYPSELSLNEEFYEENSYSKRIGEILKKGVERIPCDIPKIIMTHIFITGSEGDGDEKAIELGGARGVALEDLPEVDYIALGHIHRPIKYTNKRAYYSGSPIEYRLTENKFAKKIFIANVNGGLSTEVKEIVLENYKPIKNYEVNGIDEGVAFSQKMLDSQEWIYLKIHTDTFIPNHLLKEVRKNKNILEIIPVTKNGEVTLDSVVDYGDLDIKNAFVEFYKSFDEGEPQEETINLFMKFLGDDESATD
ncbi:exonuclease subunit SbcD [uncultured Fusobacterium sp.]|uniref:metallophosphoesterase family protein n=1 Tax=uncultured Fusobacterium sp. TaxID=159267 RepID=UPI0015A65C2E|nr:exonuclease subunit SbcD [uncultured Fusobacterium sp.]